MLSAETAVGQFPFEAIQFLAKCSKISESSLNNDELITINGPAGHISYGGASAL